MGQVILCPTDVRMQEKGEERLAADSRRNPVHVGATGAAPGESGEAAAPPPPSPPQSWEPTDVRGCDAETLVIATIQAFSPAALRRYLARRSKLQGARCFEYDPQEDGGFRIAVPSHALTIDTDIEQWRAGVEEPQVPDASLVFVRVIGSTFIAKVEAGDGDRSRLRLVKVADVPEE
mmetsp:Transcript_77240/g.218609  ORF Transcript_77240/g.218609 Transcript_77240/m.218609 type:complete len:177 (-) Transcript_77240:143-673(-)